MMTQMPVQTQGSKPTVAIITSKYYEKLAVDAMMEDKTTFVKYKTEGKYMLHVYECSSTRIEPMGCMRPVEGLLWSMAPYNCHNNFEALKQF